MGNIQAERKWKKGDSARKHLKNYLDTHPDIVPLHEESLGQHKVFEIDYNDIEGGEYKGYCVYEVTGILLD